MSIELLMPAISPTMEKGTIAKWLVSVGDVVRPGDLIAEIETDKATMEVEATDAGTIEVILIEEGTDEVPVGAVIARLTTIADVAPPENKVAIIEPPAQKAPAEAISAPAEIAAPVRERVDPPQESAQHNEKVNASPLAQRIAAASGIALSTLTGSGPRGRILKADLGLSQSSPASAPAGISSGVPALIETSTELRAPEGVPHEAVRLSNMRKAIARRLSLSKQTAPHFYLTSRCNLDRLLALRAELNAGLAAQGIKLSVNDFIIKAMGLAMRDVPDVNVQFAGDQLLVFGRADISMAVAIPSGLITPVIKDVVSLSVSAIAQTSKSLAERARAGKLQPEEYAGGTASISNLGMFGVDEMVPVLNPPQALILGVGAGVEQPWKVGEGIGLATIVALTASFDHRAIDGVAGAQFMAALREYVENPLSTLI